MPATNILIRRRTTWLLGATLVILFLLTCRLAYVQFFQGEKLRSQAIDIRMRDIPVEAKRGTIFDRNGRELVTSVSADSIYAIPAQVKDQDGTAARLAPILKMDRADIAKLLKTRASSVYIKRRVDFQTAERVKRERLPGIGLVEESRREYGKESLAAHILGFVGVDNQGLTGIEKTFDSELRGIPGRIAVERDAAGRELPLAERKYFPPVQGHNLVLTIDETIQYFVERELDKIVDTFHPASAVIIVMDPQTGEILGMGNRPTYDPNQWRNYPQQVWDRNPAIWYNYEPGSTFKIITLASALEEKAVSEKDRFYDPGYIKVADRNIHCWKGGGHGSQSLSEVVQNSCNPGFVTIGLNIGIPNFYKYLRAFGFGQFTNLGLPGEAKGILIPEKKATNLNLATMSIGQSVAVTPIQLVTGVSAAVNGGRLMQPYLVKSVTDNQGRVIKSFKPREVRRVVSDQTSRQLREYLENVVLKGTGVNAYIEGYRVGGKTGTAQVVGPSGGYVRGRYVSSFVGFAPADDPRLVTLVMVSEPQGGVYFGSQVAAPYFRSVMQDALRYLGVPEQKGLPKPERVWPYVEPRELAEVTVPQVVNLPVDEAVKDLRAEGLNFLLRGQGNVVYGQVPQAGARVTEGTTVVLDLKPAPTGKAKGDVTMPDLSGMTIKQAGTLLESLELRMEPVGSGIAWRQSVPPGKKVERGTAVRVEFRPPASENGP
ncbi:MAG: stage V sporulation protein D [Bacillota bacterium]|nr:stage V sporulation protein D [Bacillota bacterium]